MTEVVLFYDAAVAALGHVVAPQPVTVDFAILVVAEISCREVVG